MNTLKSVTELVFSFIADQPDRPAALVKNEGPSEHVLAAVSPMGRGYTVDKRPKVLAVTWGEYGYMVAEAALFLQGHYKLKRGDRVAILGWDSLPWMVINRAIQALGAIVVPLYPNTTPDQIAHILNDSEPLLLLSESDLLLTEKIKVDLLKGKTLPAELFQTVLQYVPAYNTPRRALRGGGGCQLAFRPEALAEFERLQRVFTTPGAKLPYEMDDVCTLIYTSGSTSLPKGAMITHRNISASCDLLAAVGFDFNTDDIILHFLPFAHIYGKANGMELSERFGVVSAFCTPDKMKEALTLFEPTILLGVPRLWNRIKSEIEKQASERTLKAKVLSWALKQKKGWRHQVAEILVFSSVRRKMGTRRVRMIVSGSAAIPMETTLFFEQIGLRLREGYGLTETSGGFSASTLKDFRYGSLGKPGPGAEIKLEVRPGIDTEPNTGILWVRGEFVFIGYWRKPEKNKEIFDAEGYFCTGDIVHRDEDGFYWYRGRATRQKKLDTGEFFSEETIQTALEIDSLIQAAVPTGEGRPFVGALIFIDAAAARKIAGNAPAGQNALAFYAGNAAVRAAVQAIVDQANKTLLVGETAKKWEQVRRWEIVPVEASVDNGLLTPTLKIKSEETLKRYPDMVKALYAKTGR